MSNFFTDAIAYANEVAAGAGLGPVDWDPTHSPYLQNVLPGTTPQQPQPLDPAPSAGSNPLSAPLVGGLSVTELALYGGGAFLLFKLLKKKR